MKCTILITYRLIQSDLNSLHTVQSQTAKNINTTRMIACSTLQHLPQLNSSLQKVELKVVRSNQSQVNTRNVMTFTNPLPLNIEGIEEEMNGRFRVDQRLTRETMKMSRTKKKTHTMCKEGKSIPYKL